MEIRVFGDLTINGGKLSPKERSLLAVLVLRSGNVVAPSELADAMWGDDPPATWRKQVQALVAHARRELGSSAIATFGAGYRLDVEPDSIDVLRFEHLLADAVRHRAEHDPVRAVDVIDRALSLWSGAPYSDLGEWPPAVAEVRRLEQIRATAEEDLLAARLECGEDRTVVPDAERLLRREPFRERRWAILATALYRTGRQADALATLRTARERLAEELGIAPGAELVALESAILNQDPSLEAPAILLLGNAECPYRGLQPFGTEDAEEFFGREAEVRAALDRLTVAPFLAISGASGCGKSSLVLAGIVPALRARGEHVVVIASGAAPLTRLREVLAGSAHGVVVIDQFEELFHSGFSASQVEEAGTLIADAVAAGRRVIVVVRADFLSACATAAGIGPLFADGVHLVGPLTPDGLRAAVEGPAALAGLRIEPGLVEVLLRDAAGAPAVLPHVSHALVETWARREGATLTVAGYEAAGALDGAIAQSADRLYRSLDSAQQEICRSTFLRLVEIGADGAPMRRRVGLAPLREDEAHDRVLTILARSRLVSVEEDSLIVAHESLAVAWPRLRGWLDEDAQWIRAMHGLANAASTWDADGRPDEDLYRGARLQAALEWREGHAPELTQTEAAFLDESARLHQSTLEEVRARAARDRRQNRRLRTSLGAIAGLLLVALIAGGFVVTGAAEIDRQRVEARIEALTSRAESLQATEPDVSALLAVESYRRWPEDPRTRSALMATMTGSLGMVGTGYVERVDEIAGTLIPGSREAVLVTDALDVRIVDIDSMETLRTLDIPRYGGSYLDERIGPVVSSDGTRVAAVEWLRTEWLGTDFNGRLVIADVVTGQRLLGPMLLGFDPSVIALAPDGRVLAALDGTGRLRLIDTADGSMRTVEGTLEHASLKFPRADGALQFTPDGRLLYGTMEGQLLVIDPATATARVAVQMPPGATSVSMAVLSDARVVTTGQRRIAFVDLEHARVEWVHEFAIDDSGGAPIRPKNLLPEEDVDALREDQPCPWLAASVELGTLYCGDLFGHIDERDLRTGVSTGIHHDPRLGEVGPLAVSADGKELIVIGRGSPTITRWMLDGSGPATRLVAPGWTLVDGYSPGDPQILVGRRQEGATAGSAPTEFAVLDTGTGELTTRLPVPSYRVIWGGRGILFGDIWDGHRPVRGFLDVGTGRSYGSEAIPMDLAGAFADAAGKRLFAVRANGDIWTIDPSTGSRTEPTIRTNGQVWSVSSSADGTEVIVTAWYQRDDEERISVFDGTTGEELRSGPEKLREAILDADGGILSARNDRIVRHSSTSLALVDSLPAVPGGLAAFSLSADGRTLGASGRDGTVSVYDLVAGIPIGGPLPADGLGRFSADGGQLAVDTAGGIAVWDLRPATHSEIACRMAGRDLTPDEWAAHLDGLGSYRSTCGFGSD
ncbi:BTAD domain-containing putative transcriptional regulator [Agromyces sp. NPDC056523]|uniref:nSTAND1 domain-containing NTPase n=1 Tax=Agromyces sp. NPDC056523 TaxID=3345850 RepID=UPI00366D6812